MQLNKKEIEELDQRFKINLINSITGIKPANLIATRSKAGKENVAVFSSVVHLGSSPAQIGFVSRPQTDEPKDTFLNMEETGLYTINHIEELFIKKAHYTSAKLPVGESEFYRMKIESEYLDGFFAPFVKYSSIKIGMKLMERVPLPNGCELVVGSVEMISAPDNAINDLGQIDLSKCNTTGVSGLDTYYSLNRLDSFPYVRLNEIPEFE